MPKHSGEFVLTKWLVYWLVHLIQRNLCGGIASTTEVIWHWLSAHCWVLKDRAPLTSHLVSEWTSGGILFVTSGAAFGVETNPLSKECFGPTLWNAGVVTLVRNWTTRQVRCQSNQRCQWRISGNLGFRCLRWQLSNYRDMKIYF